MKQNKIEIADYWAVWSLNSRTSKMYPLAKVHKCPTTRMLRDSLQGIHDIVPLKIDEGYGYCVTNREQYQEPRFKILMGIQFKCLNVCPTLKLEKEFNAFLG
ncbi:hypothetical protein ACOME3_005586 [Neoechinorhynchus agilis]